MLQLAANEALRRRKEAKRLREEAALLAAAQAQLEAARAEALRKAAAEAEAMRRTMVEQEAQAKARREAAERQKREDDELMKQTIRWAEWGWGWGWASRLLLHDHHPLLLNSKLSYPLHTAEPSKPRSATAMQRLRHSTRPSRRARSRRGQWQWRRAQHALRGRSA